MNRVRMLNKNEKYTPVSDADIKAGFDKKASNYKEQIESLGYSTANNVTLQPKSLFRGLFWSKYSDAYEFFEKYKACKNKVKYVEKKINVQEIENNNDHIITIEQGMVGFAEKLDYYKKLIEKTGYQYPEGLKRNGTETDLSSDTANPLKFKLEEYIQFRGPVVIAQDFHGLGAKCLGSGSKYYDTKVKVKTDVAAETFITNNKLRSIENTHEMKIVGITGEKEIELQFKTDPKFDVYEDRITSIHYDDERSLIVIREFNRANVNVTMKYFENLVDLPGDERSLSTYSFKVDFIPGIFSKIEKQTHKRSLFLFDYNQFDIINDSDQKNEAIDNYKKNSFTNYDELITGKYGFGNLRTAFKNIDDGDKKNILIHTGGLNYTSSQGCLTIFEDDYLIFINEDISANNKIFKDNKLGLAFLIRGKI